MTSPNPPVETQKGGGGYKLLAGIALTMGVAMALVILFSHRGLLSCLSLRAGWASGWSKENVRLAAENARLARSYRPPAA